MARNRIHIEAPPERAFAVLADPERFEQLPGPTSLGLRARARLAQAGDARVGAT